METLTVFLDTNVLLKAFSAFRENEILPSYITDPLTKKYTFEKCVFEAYMAFRGIGGKKPDEGRGDWAQRHLKSSNDPKPVSNLADKFHGQDNEIALYWINQILEFYGTDLLQWQEDDITKFISDEERPKALAHIQGLKQLVLERSKFDALCQDFGRFLRETQVIELPYITVFGAQKALDGTIPHPCMLDGFVRDTALPSEDFEIVYAAMTIRADIFVTDDKRLRKCAASLGLNYPLSAFRFCDSKKYEEKVQQIRELRGKA